MTKNKIVQNSDIRFLDGILEAARGRGIVVTKESIRYEFKGYGIRALGRVYEKVTAEIKGLCHDERG